MPIATGVNKQVRYKVEATFGTPPGAASAQLLRRVTSDLDLQKATYQSGELRPDMQIADFRHGVRRVTGGINGELSPRTYADFFAAALRRDFSTVTAIAGVGLTIAVGAVVNGFQQYTVTRGAGSFLTDGVKIGDVIRLSVGSLNANNINKNLFVVALTATVATVLTLNSSVMTAEGPITGCTVTVVGKKTFTPSTGHLDRSFAVEHWFPDVPTSELFLGCKVNTIDLNLPPSGLATIGLDFLGQDVQTSAAQYYTAPTAATSTGIVASVNGLLVAGGQPLAIITGLQIKIDGGYSADGVVGSNRIPAVFPGRVNVSGQFSAYFDTAVQRDWFINETEVSLLAAFTTDNSAAADFLSFVIPRLKVGGAERSDGEQGIIATFPFQALFNAAGGAGISSEQTTLSIQDSQAP